MTHTQTYLNALKAADLSTITEHSLRGDLKNLFTALAPSNTTVLHEGKREGKFGAPDFKISGPAGIIGYVENKKIDENLSSILKSDQIKKYSELSDNILLTDYLDWIWIKNGKVQARTRLAYSSDLDNTKFKLNPDREQELVSVVQGFLSQAPKGINNAKDLAKALAARTRNLKEFLQAELEGHQHDNEHGPLIGLYDTFRGNISAELTVSGFCDAFAQMLSYGLFLAKLNADTQIVDLYNAKKFIPQSFELIKELIGFLDHLENDVYKDVKWIVDEVLSVLNNLDLTAIQETLSFNQKKGGEVADPYLYFYEDFLGQYDAKLRKSKGVYYTPPAVVNFIVRAVNDTLKDTFGIAEGLGDRNRVTVLDFATGTGTFLLEVVRHIMERLPVDSPKRKLIIQEHILKNVYGFEYLIAPYTVAHLKLSQYLKENGYEVGKESSKERLQIYLTNTLEPLNTQYSAFLPALSREGEAAQKVKDKPVLVIVGNPPYSGHSKNNGAWIREKVRDYYFVDGKPLGEKNPKWLQDDYVKFIRFAQWKMEQVEEGVVAIITNHSFLDNPTFRGMRQSLIQTFDQLHFIDLHGNAKKKEHALDGSKDENVFDIEQGVAISILVKKPGLKKGVFHSDMLGTRQEKYSECLNQEIGTITWKVLNANKPFYLLRAQDEDVRIQYEKGVAVDSIFNINGLGVTTKRDGLVIDIEPTNVINRLEEFTSRTQTDEYLAAKFGLPLVDKDKWNLSETRAYLRKHGVDKSKMKGINYRPFDNRSIYYDDVLVARTVKKLFANFDRKNIGIILGRAGQNVGNKQWNLLFTTESLVDLNLFYRGGAMTFPLYTYDSGAGIFAVSSPVKSENFTIRFRHHIDNLYCKAYPPEEVLGYMYGVMHSSTYRQKYAEFLKIDFPRIPFTDDQKTFEILSELGWALIQAHLLKTIPANGLGEYTGRGANVVSKPTYSSDKLYINPAQYFNSVPAEVYMFQIGGYQVLDKYLKDRKGRTLSLDEIENIEKVVNVLAFTIEQMQSIDDLTRDWIWAAENLTKPHIGQDYTV